MRILVARPIYFAIIVLSAFLMGVGGLLATVLSGDGLWTVGVAMALFWAGMICRALSLSVVIVKDRELLGVCRRVSPVDLDRSPIFEISGQFITVREEGAEEVRGVLRVPPMPLRSAGAEREAVRVAFRRLREATER